MSKNTGNALQVVASPAPELLPGEAIALLAERYGLTATVSSLISERDQNFRVSAADGREYVLKIANKSEVPAVTRFQVQALLHVERRAAELPGDLAVPRVIPTSTGESDFVITQASTAHIVRLLSWVDGAPLAERPRSQALCRHMGTCLARLGQWLSGFADPGQNQILIWDMQRALELRPLLRHVSDLAVRDSVSRALDAFESLALPAFDGLRWQVIHSDFHPDNVLVDPANLDQLVGVIDFGDMVRAPLIVDLAVSGSYLQPSRSDPLEQIAALVAGYDATEPLLDQELDLLLHLVRTRLAASISIMLWRAGQDRGDDLYVQGTLDGVKVASNFLLQLDGLGAEQAADRFRVECGR